MLPLPSCALHANLAAEQTRDLAADRETEARAAVLAAGRAVGLLERLEDQLLLVARDADARVAHGEGEHGVRADRASAGEALLGRSAPDTQRDAALLRELECVGQQVLEHLLQPLPVGAQIDAAQSGSTVDVEAQALLLCHRPEGALAEVAPPRARETSVVIHLHLAGFDLRQVENVVDQLEQVRARGEIVCANSTCLASGCLPCSRRAAWRG